jgi:hypothetical protein
MTLIVDEQDVIEHYGVKGMKWGVRKNRTGRTPPKASADHNRTRKLMQKKTSQLTNNQLKDINNRLNLEQNYARMNPGSVKRGTARATAILSTIGVGVTAYNTVNSPAGKAAMAVGRSMIKRTVR